MWIHEYPNWTQFTWDLQALTSRLADIRYRQGRLFGRMESLGFDLQQEARLKMLTADILSSSFIEGEVLNAHEVRSSIARRLHLDIAGMVPSTRHVDGFVEVTIDAITHYYEPLTAERLFSWHAALFPAGRSGMHRISVGQWRPPEAGSMLVVSGPIGREKIHYEAPAADRLDQEMKEFLNWCASEQNLDPVLKAGIAHFWFVTIHPFEDGNGRIARAIGDLFLARTDGSPVRFYSLSRQIEAERNAYYDTLETQQRGSPDITLWLDWFLNCLGQALTYSETMLGSILFKSQIWEILNAGGVNERQRKVMNLMLEDGFKGFMNTSKYAKLAACSNDTALRDIQDLRDRGVLIQNEGGGRSTSYRIPETIPDEGRRLGG